MLERFILALIRAIAVMLLIVAPGVMISSVSDLTGQLIVLVALILGFVIVLEYSAPEPAFVGFRSLRPFNLMRFALAIVMVLTASSIMQGAVNAFAGADRSAGFALSEALRSLLDMPLSPMRYFADLMPTHLSDDVLIAAQNAIACLSLIGLLAIAAASLIFFSRKLEPVEPDLIWQNLPLMISYSDPASGEKLKRDAGLNVILAVLVYALFPAAIAATMPMSGIDVALGLTWAIILWIGGAVHFLLRALVLFYFAQRIEAARIEAAQMEAGQKDPSKTSEPSSLRSA